MNEIIRDNLESSTTNNIDEDALTILFGNSKSSRIIGQGRGITKSNLVVVDMCQDKMKMFEKEQCTMKEQISELLTLVKAHVVRFSLYITCCLTC